MPNYIVGLDVGSHTIKAAIAEIKRDGGLSLIRFIKSPSQGVRKGIVDDPADAVRAINYVLEEVRQTSKHAVRNIYLGVGGADVKVQPSKGIVAVSRADLEVCQEDVDRVLEAVRALSLPSNRMVLHSVTREFIVDAIGDIRNPVGMIGNRLEAHSLIVDAFSPNIKRATMCVEQAGGKVAGLIFSPLASSQSALSRNQKELGAALIDIGFGKTGLSVYEENKLLHTAVLPVGSGNITNDLAIGLKASVDAAETIKLTFGTAASKDVSLRDMIDLQKISPVAKGTVSRRFVSEIIGVRLAEIFDLMNYELKKIGKAHKLPGGVVLAGGGAKISGLVDLARQEMRLPAQIGLPDLTGFEIGSDVGVEAEDPEYACVFGLVSYGYELLKENQGDLISSGGATNFFKKFFRLFNP